MTKAWPDLSAIDEGYYAVLDPDGQETITYWRRVRTAKVDALKAWPAKAWYGPPIPRRSEVPTDRAERDKFVAAWSERRRVYVGKVVAAITSGPEVAGRCFADFRSRCCMCGRALRDNTSKTYGIGPECRSGMDPAVLARYCTPEVGWVHAKALKARKEAP
ncbi:DUF6011 domain-containing protein [Streptomyces sp. NBC_01763]|uniref:DUF6011 domain-containing protein n=1 Tax=Streptomyces sp. NBC_01763 TaxID=2975934 RepID=UPI002DDC037E|nr:DUF6011 domain-containing protein [Streptomyces sp. NBC_01763]WSC35661.1 DUF6011 domain-containing protein [Streptomyces sp. NBC_01763]